MENRFGERPKMTGEERAKQFMPFAALKGYEEAIRQKEMECIQKTNESDIIDAEYMEYLFRNLDE